jgi:hypothetical protein
VKVTKNKWTTNNTEKVRENGQKWDKLNPGKKAAQVRKYQASKLNATPKWLTKEQLKEMQALYVEAALKTRETGIPHEVDHEEPLQGKNICGLHVPWNLKVVTRTENRKKSNTGK